MHIAGNGEVQSVIAVPLMAGERLLGAIALGACKGSLDHGEADVRLAEELAWRVATALENARLYRAANDAAKARDEVLAIVAHDLRNPLSTIVLQAAALRCQSPSRAAVETTAATIERAATRMMRLIEDLLDIGCIEAGRLSMQPARVEVRTFLIDFVESQRHLARAASIDLRLQAPTDMATVLADRHRLSQVFENLVGNALQFTGSGGQVTVAAQVREADVLFSVRDSGSGIPPEHLPHVFDRFWQARRVERQGAGLGLSIAKAIVEMHGGRIWVESTPGEGSCFLFTFRKSFVGVPALHEGPQLT